MSSSTPMDFTLSKSFFFLLFFAIFAADDITAAETLAVPPHHYTALPPAHPPAHHHHHHHAPTPAPVAPPTHLPVHPPAQAPSPHHHHHVHGQPPVHPPVNAPPHHLPPTHPPAHSPAPGHHHRDVRPLLPPPSDSPAPIYPPKPRLLRSFISVEGVVYCKSCKYAGADTLLGATPVAGATVKLICENTKYPLLQTATTDNNGYFFISAPKLITSYAFHKCKVLLGSSSTASCTQPSALHGGATGAPLRPHKSYIDANNLPFVLYSVGPFAFQPTSCPHH